MAENTKIEWCTTSLNPYPGCSDVVLNDGTISPACTRCYAKRGAARMAQNPKLPRYRGLAVFTEQGPQWTGRQTFVPSELDKLRGFTKPHRIFWESMGDIAHESTPLEWFRKVWWAIHETRAVGHWHYLLTKRPQRLAGLLRAMQIEAGHGVYAQAMERVVVMTTTEDQRCAEERVPALLECPARYFGVSAEPLVGPLDLRRWMPPRPQPGHAWAECLCREIDPSDRPCVVCEARRGLSWVICGGMSGPGATPMHPAWARDLRDQCAAAGVLYFFKQHGEWAPTGPLSAPQRIVFPDGQHFAADDVEGMRRRSDTTEWQPVDQTALWGEWQPVDQSDAPVRRHTFSDGTICMRIGKHAAGRLLDGVEHGAYPGREVRHVQT